MKASFRHIPRKLTTALLLLLVLSLICPAAYAQDKEIDGWTKSWIEGVGELLLHDYTRYSREDVAAAQVKLQQLKDGLQRPQGGEWAGVYRIDYMETDIGTVSLEAMYWSPQSGFINYYVYTCLPELRHLNFGEATSLPGIVKMTPEYPARSGRRQQSAINYVKVKWGARHYLIPEDTLDDFSDSVAGLTLRRMDEAITIQPFWLKSDDFKKPSTGWPVLPPGYERFLKRPIEAVITEVGAGRILKDYDDGQIHYDSANVTSVTLNKGSAEGVKVNMNFRALKTGETVRIKQASQHSSTGIIVRDVQAGGEQEREECSPKIRIGWRLTTRPEHLSY